MLLVQWCELNNRHDIIESLFEADAEEILANITHGAHKELQWRCAIDSQHIWRAKVYNRIKRECPYCANRTIHKSNSLATAFDLDFKFAALWAQDLNKERPDEIIAVTSNKLYWRCPECCHSWLSSPKTRSCPVCSMRELKVGFNDFASLYPELVIDWSPKNKVAAKEYLPRSKDTIQWLCNKCSGEWSTALGQRTAIGRKCPYCSHQRLLKGLNDFWTLHPELHKEWSPKNTIDPAALFSNSSEVAEWICRACKRVWSTTVVSRAKGRGCVYCKGKRVIRGLNDLEFLAPELAKAIGDTTDPSTVFRHSTKSIPFKCQICFAKFSEAPTKLRASLCGQCRSQTSQGEESLSKFLTTIIDFERNDRTTIAPFELDFISRKLRIAVEYNGVYWHSDRVLLSNTGQTAAQRHGAKTERAKEKSITLLYVWEDDWLKRRSQIEAALIRACSDPTDIDPILTILSKG